MFKLNKIRAHIKMLDFEKLKLDRYLEESIKITPRDPKRESDIERALRRVNANIDMWNKKLAAFESQVKQPLPRDAIINDRGGPLIG